VYLLSDSQKQKTVAFYKPHATRPSFIVFTHGSICLFRARFPAILRVLTTSAAAVAQSRSMIRHALEPAGAGLRLPCHLRVALALHHQLQQAPPWPRGHNKRWSPLRLRLFVLCLEGTAASLRLFLMSTYTLGLPALHVLPCIDELFTFCTLLLTFAASADGVSRRRRARVSGATVTLRPCWHRRCGRPA
jgi:hypothetical protein